MANRILIGKGMFSKAYLLPCGNVEIHSTDKIKECMALWGFGDCYLWPTIERTDTFWKGDSLVQVYKMPFYEKVTAPKQQLNAQAYELYKLLRDMEVPVNLPRGHYERPDYWREQFQTLPDKFAIERQALLEAVDSIQNYTYNIGFEISPRNISVGEFGDLILLDCFFDTEEAFQIIKSKQNRYHY